MRKVITILVLFAPAIAFANEPATLLDEGYRQLYNLQFDAAHRTFTEYSRSHPEDPVGPASDAAAYLFAEFERLNILQSEFFVHDDSFKNRRRPAPDPELKRGFERALQTSRQIAQHILLREPKDRNALFASVLVHGLKADYTALVETRYLASLSEMKTGRAVAQRLLASHPECFDAYLAIGVENYILSLKPAPVRWLLRLGGAATNKEEGLRQLRLTAAKGRYLMPYARLLLAVAALRDQDRKGAAEILRWLASEFPQNPLYARELARLTGGRG